MLEHSDVVDSISIPYIWNYSLRIKNYYFRRICKEAETERKKMNNFKHETTLTAKSLGAKVLPFPAAVTST